MTADDTIEMWANKASELNAALADTTDELREVENKLDLTHRMVRSQRYIMIVMGAMLCLTLVIAVGNRLTFNAVKSCTTPGGECFERGARNTAEAVQRLNAENQRQHNQLREELRTGTTAPARASRASTTTRGENRPTQSPESPANDSPGTTTPGNSTTSTTARRQTTTSTTRRPTTTTRPSSTTTALVCVGGVCI